MAASPRSLRLTARLALASITLASAGPPAGASHGGHPGHSSVSLKHPGASPPMVFPGGGFTGSLPAGDYRGGINYNPGIFLGYGAGGYYPYSPPLTVIGGGGFVPFTGPFLPEGFGNAGMGTNNGGLNLPMPPIGVFDPITPRPRPRHVNNPARAKELVEIGDRSYRAHNIKRAEERYLLAIKADPASPTPHVHLAQVSLARGQYAAAADHLRDAVTVAADGAWLANAPDIQAIFAEPADFARQLAKLETHLQANPNDRDAWFVLGAETYLSGRPRQAFDVFQRLTDRRTDEATTAFLDASRPRPAEAATN